MLKGIKNIVFDMGGVLVDLDRQRCIDSFLALGYPAEELALNNYSQPGIFGLLESGAVGPREFCDHVREKTGREQLTDAQIAAAFNSFVVGLPVYKLQMLLELRRRFSVYMLSNTSAVMFPEICDTCFTQQGLSFDDYFDRAFLSFEMGCIKPDEEIFRKMIAQSGMIPGQTLFIDDSRANVETASRLGFRTYLAGEREDFRHIFDGI